MYLENVPCSCTAHKCIIKKEKIHPYSILFARVHPSKSLFLLLGSGHRLVRLAKQHLCWTNYPNLKAATAPVEQLFLQHENPTTLPSHTNQGYTSLHSTSSSKCLAFFATSWLFDGSAPLSCFHSSASSAKPSAEALDAAAAWGWQRQLIETGCRLRWSPLGETIVFWGHELIMIMLGENLQ